MPEPDCWKALDAKVIFVEKPSSVTQPGEGASGSETSVVKVCSHLHHHGHKYLIVPQAISCGWKINIEGRNDS